jgi:putative aldouronate transport system permease protein
MAADVVIERDHEIPTAPDVARQPKGTGRGGASAPRSFDWFQGMSIGVISLFAIACIAPFWLIVASSFTREDDLVNSGYSFWPKHFSLEAYRAIFSGQSVLDEYFASLFITIVGTAIALVTTSALAYVIASNVRGLSRPLSIMTYIPMLFTGGLVPFYILVTQYLKLSNSLWSVILPGLVSPFLVFIMVSFFRALPTDVLEAARIDGASELRILVQVVVPMSKPILATIGLFYALAYWSEWFDALLFISDRSKFPLQLMLQNLIANVNAAEAIQTSATANVPIYALRGALVTITIGPVIFFYPFIQRYFVKGLTLGAVK